MSPLVESMLLRSFVLFLIVGSLAGLVVGALLLLSPHRLRLVSGILNRWISTRHMDRSLESPIKLDSWFYRYRRISAGLILLGSGYIMYVFTFNFDRIAAGIGLSRRFNLPGSMVGALMDALVLCSLLGALFAAFVSLFLLLRPSLLRDFEQEANRWVSLRQALKPLEIQREGVDEYVFKYGPQAGILLVLGSLYTLVMLTLWISHYR